MHTFRFCQFWITCQLCQKLFSDDLPRMFIACVIYMHFEPYTIKKNLKDLNPAIVILIYAPNAPVILYYNNTVNDDDEYSCAVEQLIFSTSDLGSQVT